jgi:hypothetical protein
MRHLLFFFWALIVPATSWAFLPVPSEKTGIGQETSTVFTFGFSGADDYRLGDEWGKKAVAPENLNLESAAFRRAALAAAKVGGATGFYVGKFNGEYVMATNYHVYQAAFSCLGNRVSFPLLNVSGTCDRFIGSWSDVDLALFTIKLRNPADAPKLESVAGNFTFREDVRPGQKLLTIGFGIADNPMRSVMANRDSDCYVFSQQGEYRFMADPDRFNPGNYRAWSFALGCDVSHGDSGSAIVDRESGKVVGIIWTGNIPKSAFVQSSAKLSEIFRANDRAIWEELSYAVPARKIGEHLTGLLQSGGLSERDKALLRAMLQ